MKVPSELKIPLFILMSPIMFPLGLFLYLIEKLDILIMPLGNFWANLLQDDPDLEK